MKLPKLAVLGAGAFLAAATLGFIAVLAGEARQAARDLAELRATLTELREAGVAARTGQARPNVLTTFNADVNLPVLDTAAFVDPMASVIGDVALGPGVFVAPFASIRGDEGQPIALGEDVNVQDGVVIHALETEHLGHPVPNRTYEVQGKPYAVFIGRRVSLAHQSQVHGPARIDDDVFIGMQALVFKATIGTGVVVEPGARVIGVNVPRGRYVPAGMVLTSQGQADQLPEITETYPFRGLNEAVVHVNTSFARGYGARARSAEEPAPPPTHGGAVAAAPAHAAPSP